MSLNLLYFLAIFWLKPVLPFAGTLAHYNLLYRSNRCQLRAADCLLELPVLPFELRHEGNESLNSLQG